MDFLGVSKRINDLLYRKEVVRLRRSDVELAKKWTLELIREGNPSWDEEQVQRYYDRLLDIRVVAVDEWAKRMGEIKTI